MNLRFLTDIVSVAILTASSLGKPILTPPSAIACIKVNANAIPLPLSAVNWSSWCSGKKWQEKMQSKKFLIQVSILSSGGKILDIPQTPLPTWQAKFG